MYKKLRGQILPIPLQGRHYQDHSIANHRATLHQVYLQVHIIMLRRYTALFQLPVGLNMFNIFYLSLRKRRGYP